MNCPSGLNTSSAHQLIFEFLEPMISREDDIEHSTSTQCSSMLDAESPLLGPQRADSSHFHPHGPEGALIGGEQHEDVLTSGNELLDSLVPDVGLPPGLPSSLPPNLQDLLELYEAGESVIWPPGYDAHSASQLLKKRRLA